LEAEASKNWVLQGDANTHFFHQYANGRRRKNTIAVLDSDFGEIRGQQNLTNHIVDFYKHLFGRNDPCNFQLNDGFWENELMLSESDQLTLIKDFSLEEMKEIVFYMKTNSVPGPNGFGVIFFREYWEIIKDDIFFPCSRISNWVGWISKGSITG
jgi:hypothetical protein